MVGGGASLGCVNFSRVALTVRAEDGKSSQARPNAQQYNQQIDRYQAPGVRVQQLFNSGSLGSEWSSESPPEVRLIGNARPKCDRLPEKCARQVPAPIDLAAALGEVTSKVEEAACVDGRSQHR